MVFSSSPLFILDDGFQHWKLYRDRDIVLIDSIRGFGNGHLLPRGILREPASSLKRATHILISGDDGKEIVDKIALSNINSIRSFRYVPTGIVNLTNNTKFPIDCLKNKKVLAFSGIANPVSFFITLKNTGAIIKNTFVFKDHHRYTIKNLDNIKRDSCGTAYIITTEKDSVKIKDILPSDMDVYAMTIDIVIDNEQEFLTQIC
ncbi:MAG: tetraacyldisaccharide 4'-kinase [Deltaproteobacteria bacterium]|nr:tetraacyldisaccharide 4'-kinase [Deltaproteobacteria bacterium]